MILPNSYTQNCTIPLCITSRYVLVTGTGQPGVIFAEVLGRLRDGNLTRDNSLTYVALSQMTEEEKLYFIDQSCSLEKIKKNKKLKDKRLIELVIALWDYPMIGELEGPNRLGVLINTEIHPYGSSC